MGNPLSHYDFRHTCPTCNRPVKHGDKFCEVCGTKIPSLSTCSKCGTQFIHPKKFCDLCGAPFILEEVLEPEADEIQVPVLEEIPVTESDEVPEPAEEETLEPAEEETLEPDEEEIPEPDEEEIPEQDEEEIPEPDTDELLKQFGEEYGDDETLESNNKPKPTSPLQHEAKKPVTVPALQRRGSSKTADDALFLLDTEPAPAKPPVNKIRIIGGGIVLITILAAVFFIGLPMLTGIGVFSAHSNPTAAEITPIPTIASLTVKPTPASRALIPQPTQLNPADQKFRFQVRKDPITSKITVIFTGSAGEGSITSADVKVTHADGSVTMGIILPLKGVSDITLDGSKETDRVEIIAKMTSGETYRVYDDLVSLIK